MKGAFIHNIVLVRPVESFFVRLGGSVDAEHPVRSGRHSPAVDLYVRFGVECIVCEGERTPRRVLNDLFKAQQLRADLLIFVAPDMSVVRAIARRLENRRHVHGERAPEIWVGTVGSVLQRLEDRFGTAKRALGGETGVRTERVQPRAQKGVEST